MGLINILDIPERTFLRKSSYGGLGLLCFGGFVFCWVFSMLFGFVFNKQEMLQVASGLKNCEHNFSVKSLIKSLLLNILVYAKSWIFFFFTLVNNFAM